MNKKERVLVGNIFSILFLLFCGNFAFVHNGFFYTYVQQLTILEPMIIVREVGNFIIIYIYNIVVIWMVIHYIFFVLPNINMTSYSLLEFIFGISLLYRGMNEILYSFLVDSSLKVGSLTIYLFYVLLFYSIINTVRRMDENGKGEFYYKLINLFILVGIINSLIIGFQFFIEYNTFYKAMPIIDTLRYIRPISLMGVVTVNSMFIGFSILLTIWRRYLSDRRISNAKFLLILSILIGGEVLTSSRGGLLIVLVTLIHVLACNYSRINLKFNKIIKFGIGLVIAVMVLIPFSTFVLNYLNNVFLSESASSSNNSRLLKWELALNLFKENPIFGIGTNRYNMIQAEITSGWSSSNPHNLFLQILSENGLVYFLLMSSIFIYLLYSLHASFIGSKYYGLYPAYVYWFYSSFYMSTLDNMILGASMITIVASLQGLKTIRGNEYNEIDSLSVSRLEKI